MIRRTEDQNPSSVAQTWRSHSGSSTSRCRPFTCFVLSPFVLGDIVSQNRIVKCDSGAIEEFAKQQIQMI